MGIKAGLALRLREAAQPWPDEEDLRAPLYREAAAAIEFGCYLASAADRYLDYINSPKPDDDRLSEDYRALRSAIYEFRKRATRAD